MFSLLHCHFESVLRAVALRRPHALKQLERIFSSTHYHTALPAQRLQLLEEQIQRYAIEHKDIFTKQTFELLVYEFLQQLEQSQIIHVDLRMSICPKKWPWMRTIADGIQLFEHARQQYPHISLAFLGAVNFAKPYAEIDEIFECLFHDQFVQHTFVGLDINVLPEDLPKLAYYAPTLQTVQQQGMKINVHLGELFDNTFSKEVLSYIVPHRIGHGVKLLEDENLIRFLQQHDICLDMCPVSNTRLGVFDWNQSFNPAKQAIQLSIPCTINTDDPMLFQTTLQQEIALARLNAEEIKHVQAMGRKYGYHHE